MDTSCQFKKRIVLLETFRTLNDFKRKANKRKFAYMLKSMCSVTWYPWRQYNRSNLVSNSENRACRSHEKFLLWTNSVEIKHTFFVHPAFPMHWNLHPWWRVDIQLSNTFEYDFRWEFFTVRFRLKSEVWLFIKSEGSSKKVYALYVYHFSYQLLAFVFTYIIKCVTFSLSLR